MKKSGKYIPPHRRNNKEREKFSDLFTKMPLEHTNANTSPGAYIPPHKREAESNPLPSHPVKKNRLNHNTYHFNIDLSIFTSAPYSLQNIYKHMKPSKKFFSILRPIKEEEGDINDYDTQIQCRLT